MSELPERKVLKQALVKLKSKAMTSFEIYYEYVKMTQGFIDKTYDGIKERVPAMNKQERVITLSWLDTLGKVISLGNQLYIMSLDVLSDWKTYTEILESYSSELDSTLAKIFEDAVKQSEEQIEKQKELIGKTPEYTR